MGFQLEQKNPLQSSNEVDPTTTYYLRDCAIEVLHVIAKAGGKLAKDFFVPCVIFHVHFGLNLIIPNRCRHYRFSTEV